MVHGEIYGRHVGVHGQIDVRHEVGVRHLVVHGQVDVNMRGYKNR